MKDKYKNIQLVKTDYDDFKTMRFFIDQQQKAEAMLKEVEEFKSSFIQSKLVSYEDWFKVNIDPNVGDKELYWEFQRVHGRHWGPSPYQKNCVIHKGTIKFVSSQPEQYSVEISKNNKKITFCFGDEYTKPSKSGFGQSEIEYGMTKLTYDIDTNELVKYERPWK